MMSYQSDQVLRNLEPQQMTSAQQREVDAQLGAAVAAVTRRVGSVTRCVRARARQAAMVAAAVGQGARAFRKLADESASPRSSGACR
ncbi:MAG TPA: hypothetical protein VFW16_07725 [Streptosporangiaceae bacterium]|nr:hypothetical protein [Streptosporangiaceae bacterium]